MARRNSMTYCATASKTIKKRSDKFLWFWYDIFSRFFCDISLPNPKKRDQAKPTAVLGYKLHFKLKQDSSYTFFSFQFHLLVWGFEEQRIFCFKGVEITVVLFRRSLILPNILRLLSSFWTNWRQRVEPVSFYKLKALFLFYL